MHYEGSAEVDAIKKTKYTSAYKRFATLAGEKHRKLKEANAEEEQQQRFWKPKGERQERGQEIPEGLTEGRYR